MVGACGAQSQSGGKGTGLRSRRRSNGSERNEVQAALKVTTRFKGKTKEHRLKERQRQRRATSDGTQAECGNLAGWGLAGAFRRGAPGRSFQFLSGSYLRGQHMRRQLLLPAVRIILTSEAAKWATMPEASCRIGARINTHDTAAVARGAVHSLRRQWDMIPACEQQSMPQAGHHTVYKASVVYST